MQMLDTNDVFNQDNDNSQFDSIVEVDPDPLIHRLYILHTLFYCQ